MGESLCLQAASYCRDALRKGASEAGFPLPLINLVSSCCQGTLAPRAFVSRGTASLIPLVALPCLGCSWLTYISSTGGHQKTKTPSTNCHWHQMNWVFEAGSQGRCLGAEGTLGGTAEPLPHLEGQLLPAAPLPIVAR